MKKVIITLLAVALLLTSTIYIPISFYPLNKILLKSLEKRLDADITCRSLKIYLWRSLVAEGVEALGIGGFALSAENVEIDYDLTSLITGRLRLTCDLKNVRFYKGGSIINSLSDILQIQPLGNLTFDTVHANLYVGMEDTLTQDLTFLSDKIKIFGNAITDRDKNIKCLLYFHLSDNMTSEIPSEIRDSLLQKEEGPWSSLYLGVMGNYKKPMLTIMTDRFKMKIVSN